jgi:hypothetical protein
MMKKGQFELIELTMLVVAISIMLIISYFMFTTRTPKLNRLVTEEYTYSRLGDVVTALYNVKVSGTERTLAQLLADRVATKSGNISYGWEVGIINVDEQATEFFGSYLDEKWNLTDDQFSLGYEIPKDITRKITYPIVLPIPSILYSKVVILNLNTWLE